MDPFVLMFTFAGLALGVFVATARKGLRGPLRAEALRALEQGFGLKSDVDPETIRMWGNVDGAAVEIEATQKATRMAVYVHDLWQKTSVRGEKVLERRLAGPDVEVGDPTADAALRIDGDPARLTALLSTSRRLALMQAIRGGADLEDGWLRIERLGPPASGDALCDDLEALLRWARRARPTGSIADELLDNVGSDRAGGVRERSLELLHQRFRGTPQHAEAMGVATSDPDAGVRLAAAIFRGDAGIPTVRAIAANPQVPVEVRARAADHLAATLGPADAGRLAIVDAGGGELSPAAVEGGLSDASDDDTGAS